MTETYLFTGELTVWIHQNASPQPSSSNAINPCLGSQPAPPPPMQMNPPAAPTSIPLLQTRTPVHAASIININIVLTVRESEYPL